MTHEQTIVLLSSRRWLTSKDAPLAILRRLARAGYAGESGQLFHATPDCDRFAREIEQMPPWGSVA
jgi:hypothetical protein